MPHRSNSAIAIAALLLLAGCGGSEDAEQQGNPGPVAAKAVADVDAAMADAQRAPVASPRP